jgi:hypothetical protein
LKLQRKDEALLAESMGKLGIFKVFNSFNFSQR